MAGWPVGLSGLVRPHRCPVSLRQPQRGVQLAQQRGGGVLDVMTLASARILLEGVASDMLRPYTGTLRHRLQRVKELTGRRLDNAHDRGDLCLAFEAGDLAATSG